MFSEKKREGPKKHGKTAQLQSLLFSQQCRREEGCGKMEQGGSTSDTKRYQTDLLLFGGHPAKFAIASGSLTKVLSGPKE